MTKILLTATLMLITGVGAESIVINITVAVNKIFFIVVNVVLFSGAFKCDICEKMFTAVWSLNDRNYQATKISRHIKSKIHQKCSQLKFAEMFTSESL